MFGCCGKEQRKFRKNYDTPPDLGRLNKIYPELGEIAAVEEREFQTPRPRKNWVMILADDKVEEVCTCGCHVVEGCAILC